MFSDKYFKRAFGNSQRGTESIGVSNSDSDIIIGHDFKRVHDTDSLDKHVIKNIVDPCAAKLFTIWTDTIPAVNNIIELNRKLVQYIQQQSAFVLFLVLVYINIPVFLQLFFLMLDLIMQLHPYTRQILLNPQTLQLVQMPDQITDPELMPYVLVPRLTVEVLFLVFLLLPDLLTPAYIHTRP